MTFANVGEVIAGKYRVDKILAIGGMGMIVAATHVELGQRVALKFMLPDGAASPTAVARFMREAQAAVRLRSEHVCRVHDVGRFDNGAPYIVMELLEGTDLSKLIKRGGPLPLADAIDLVLQALEGVAEAHARGIVHRDLKPGNLFVTRDSDDARFVKVLDFGISKSAFGDGATQTGDVMGSPAYMAPEQMQSSKNVDVRADVWSLGVICYYAVSGRLPFEGDTLPNLCMRVMNDPPRPLEQVRADLPEAFVAVVMRCLDKSPANRFADVEELARALAPFGTRDPATITRRIAKVLRRAPSEPVTTVRAPTVEIVSTKPTTVAMLPSALAEPDTTFQSSAAEVSIEVVPAPTEQRRKRKAAVLGLAAIGVIVGTIVAMVASTGRETPAAVDEARPYVAPTAPPPVEHSPAARPPVEVAPPARDPAPPDPAPPPPPVKAVRSHAAKRALPNPDVKPADVKVEPTPDEPKPADVASPEPKPAGSKWTHMQHDGKTP